MNINIDDFPQLAILASQRSLRTISEQEAYALYEANKRFIDDVQLHDRERELIKRLVNSYSKK